MIINNKDISVFNIKKVLSFEVDNSKYENNGSYWSNGSLLPIVGMKSETYRSLNIKLLFNNTDKEKILKDMSKFIEESKDCIFKENNLLYKCEMNGSGSKDRINSTHYTLDIDFNLLNIYENEKSITTTANTSITINSPKLCYANLEISSTTNVISYTVKVNDDEILVRNIKANETIYIGSGKVIAGGKSKMNDVDMWEFPILKPGVNNITVNRADVTLKVKYNERW